MRRYLQLLGQYFSQYAKVRLAYKGDFIVSVLTTMVATAFGVALVFILFQRAPEIAGWRFNEILFLYGFGLIPLSLFNVVSVNLYYFGESYIIEGKFDRVLLRPVHSLFQVMSEQFRLEALSDTAVGLFIVVYTSRQLGLQYGLDDWAFLVAAAFLSKYLPKVPLFTKSKLILAAATAADHAPRADDSPLLRLEIGAYGKAVTPLRPVGTVRFGEDLLDAMCEGTIIDSGARVRVVRREGNRIVVEERKMT